MEDRVFGTYMCEASYAPSAQTLQSLINCSDSVILIHFAAAVPSNMIHLKANLSFSAPAHYAKRCGC